MVKMYYEDVRELAAACLASGTHRLKFVDNGMAVELVEREEPDTDVLYMKRGKSEGPFVVCPTPFTTPEGREIEVLLIQDSSSPVGFNIIVNTPEVTGRQKFTPFDPRTE